jgi:hypothetical protein
MCRRIVRRNGKGLANPSHREIMTPNLSGDDAKTKQRLRVAGFHREDLEIKSLGFPKTPRLMMLEGQRKGLWDRNRGHGRHSVSDRHIR